MPGDDPASIIGATMGAAHLKYAAFDAGRAADGRLGGSGRAWIGSRRLAALPTRLGQDTHHHALTMTGELAGCFRDREEGVRALVSYMVRRLGGHRILVYAGHRGFLGAARAGDHALDVASAN